ncbi:hypothetical protein [Candidatus Solirubrobacter pratensis]|uniref:hypothetical protein n=1 Tax=Candidatus Solirubrobacter pratensis TaxID=1298857 RepID=UPI0003F65F0D|nr:hypothetical protein [Candidatus Solirubrobacter pratensis]
MRTITLVAALLALLVASCGGDDRPAASGAGGATTATATASATQDADAGQAQDGDSDADKAAEQGGKDKPCADAGDLAGEPKAKPPADLALPGDAHVYESEGPFGKTTRYFAVTEGGPDDLPAKRDDASDILVENGYKLLAKDQEEGAEAEAHLSGKHAVDIQVISLCEGKLRIRYTVS